MAATAVEPVTPMTMTTTRNIEDVRGLSADARRLYDWMIAAFTGDVNQALADAQRYGAEISTWTSARLRRAHAELKRRGVLAPEAPDLAAPKLRHHAKKKSGGVKHWKVKFTRRGMEPPRPFGKTTAVVCAESREAAREMVPASPNYPITVSATKDPVSFTYRCHHTAEDEPSTEIPETSASKSAHAIKKKSAAQLDREIAEVLGRWEEDLFGGYRFITTSEGIRFDTAGVDPTYYRDPKWRQRWEFDLKREIEKLKAGKPTKLYKMSAAHYRLPGIV